MAEKPTPKDIEYFCENFDRILPFLNATEKDMKNLMKDPDLERIVTAILIPYLQNKPIYVNHVANCEKNLKAYRVFLEDNASAEKSIDTLDQEYLGIYPVYSSF